MKESVRTKLERGGKEKADITPCSSLRENVLFCLYLSDHLYNVADVITIVYTSFSLCYAFPLNTSCSLLSGFLRFVTFLSHICT